MEPLQMILLFLISMTTLPGLQTQDNVFLSCAHSYANVHNTSNCWVCGAMPLSVMDVLSWWVSPLCRGDFSSLCSFLRQQQEVFASSVTHNLSLLIWCNLDFSQIDQGHGIIFEVNASLTKVTKAYTFYLKNKRNENSMASKKGKSIR